MLASPLYYFCFLPIPRGITETIDKATLVQFAYETIVHEILDIDLGIQDPEPALVSFRGKVGVNCRSVYFAGFKSLVAHDPVAEWLSTNLKVRSRILFENLL